MDGKLNAILDKIYHDMAISELRRAYSQNTRGNLSYHDVLYLNIIEAHPNEYTASQIADMLGITRPSVTQKINELCKKGYVIRTQSEKDKRVYYLAVNPENVDFYDLSREETFEIEKIIIKKYGKEKIDLLCEVLEDISNLSSMQIEKGGKNE